MEFNTAMLTRFIGGELEIEDFENQQLYRGAIKKILVGQQSDGVVLTVELDWWACKSGYRSIHAPWRPRPERTHTIMANDYKVIEFGEGQVVFEPKINTVHWSALRPKGQSLTDKSEIQGA